VSYIEGLYTYYYLSQFFDIDTIVVLETPYKSDIFPPIPAAIAIDSKKIPITPTIRAIHREYLTDPSAELRDVADDVCYCMKNSWALLPSGVMFINVDWLPLQMVSKEATTGST